MANTIALLGNPNCGKTTLFNALTGARQRTGNWAGVTVDKKEGNYSYHNKNINIVDLPGIYSMSSSDEQGSLDERIACEYILSDEADLVVNIIDAANIERNLYLTLQLLEMKIPCIIVLNMLDIAKQKNINIDAKKLESELGCPVVSLVANKSKGLDDLKSSIEKHLQKKSLPRLFTQFPPELDHTISQLSDVFQDQIILNNRKKWLAIRLLESDSSANKYINGTDIASFVSQLQADFSNTHNENIDLLIADARYQTVAEIIHHCISSYHAGQHNLTQWIDKVVLNRYLGIPIFLIVMYLMFWLSINIGGGLQPIFDEGSAAIFINGTAWLCSSLGFPSWLTAILSQGLGGGINTVMPFIPQIGLMFLYLSILEDSGYMARAAFVIDRFMSTIGLPGKSFVPLIVGFGCNIPSIMASRTLDTPRDRILTSMMAPFMSCGARLAIFGVFSAAFFHGMGSFIVFSLYLLGIFVAVITGFVLKKTLLTGEASPYIMELPTYHLPSVKTTLIHSWSRLRGFLVKACKIIIPICMLVMALNSVNFEGQVIENNNQQNSALSEIGRWVTPVLSPLGVNEQNWPASVGLLTGFLAKEVVVGTLNTLYSAELSNNQAAADDGQSFHLLSELKVAWQDTIDGVADSFSLSTLKNPIKASEADGSMGTTAMGQMHKEFGSMAGAYAYLIFVLLYVPCVSTIGVIAKEIGRNWAWLSTAWGVVVAYALSIAFYQTATFKAHPLESLLWLFFAFSIVTAFIIGIKRLCNKVDWQMSIPDSPATHNCGGCH
ncbi:Fe(2+) transporter permease subunit FeoB [Photobacterium angustum]|uniref:Ferrous iron transport protein B n=1 Tax=Photobacterium angustum TaxID=661 RepID=A0A855SA17_PHOAN|nr:Fe(2+) transporter permease subunit FeoB [Photobacterium angustum]KJF81737.1 ferrous iron transporter B [Photobacterium damselae subsp. damselae]KJG28354.1 ferrous iron transporter B [Photobacterium angustum]KJG36637.1 ferrous iron transporter B [Photobacterium angustum]KJG45411.1 ferrous iron transporter B [Photobacterium angustum]KJG46048.1 ferrous iron transporter B [Photobacterium angustum]